MFSALLVFFTADTFLPDGRLAHGRFWEQSLALFLTLAPYLLGGVTIWFIIAYFTNTAIIRSATGALPLQRRGKNKRIYNMVENLSMAQGMAMPKIDVIEDDSLNAFASGIDDRSYTVSLSRGLINTLDDEELEGVIAHELAHIRNRDVRLLIISIVFVGIFAMLSEIALRGMLRSGRGRSSSNGKGAIAVFLIALLVAAIGYLLALLMRFAISRKREYMADAMAAEMTSRPQALANALRKISQKPNIAGITRNDVAQLFIEHPLEKKNSFLGISSLFATHPPIEKRIAILEQF